MNKDCNTKITAPSIIKQLESADLLVKQKKYEQALGIYEHLKNKIYDKYREDKAKLFFMMGNCYYNLGEKEKAIEAYEKSLELNTKLQHPEVFNILGYLYYYIDSNKSIDNYLKGMEYLPDIKNFVVLAHMLLRSHRFSQKDIKNIMEKYVNIFRPTILKQDKLYEYDYKNFEKHKKLKIGYLSSDFHCHAMMQFMLPIFETHNNKKFDIYLYSCSKKSDFVTERIKNSIKNFVDCSDLSNRELAEKIHNDKIDILIDIGGYTHKAVWSLLYKPAPVIIQYLGFLGTYGMKEVDYILTDEFIIPEEMAPYYTEKPLYIDYGINRFTFNTKNQKLENIVPLPYDSNGYVTFGSFNTIEKISPYTVSLWSKALKALPNSKLLIYRTQLKEYDIKRFKKQFAVNGIDENRLIFDNKPMPTNHMRAYMLCDVALDPSSFSGLTITLEQAFMGVPVITMPWEIISSRGSAEVNYALGLDYLVANSEEEYIDIVANIEKDIDYIRWLRFNLRNIAFKSPICNDYREYTKHIESVYQKAWNTFCAGV